MTLYALFFHKTVRGYANIPAFFVWTIAYCLLFRLLFSQFSNINS